MTGERKRGEGAGRVPDGTPAAVITVSDGVVAGTRNDESGAVLEELLAARGFRVSRAVVADDRDAIQEALRQAAASSRLIVTTGGTGLTPRDVTPQATSGLLDYEVPGLAEAMRAAGRATTPMADLSRGLVGVLAGALVVNVPGSPRAASESIEAIASTFAHALETLGGPFDHGVAGPGTSRPDLPAPGGGRYDRPEEENGA